MKVSIVTPVFNSESTIEDTIKSVLNQDFENWEWILYDDCSTDKSLTILKKYASSDKRIKILNGTSGPFGPSYGRNRCLEYVSGDIVAFLDADDLWMNNYLKCRIEAHEKYPEVGMVYGPAIYFYEDKNIEYLQDTGISESKIFDKKELFLNFITNIKGTPCPGATTVHSLIAQKIRFPNQLNRGEDIAFFLMINKISPVLYDARPLFRYRRHSMSSTSQSDYSGTPLESEHKFHKWLLEFFKNEENYSLKNIATN